MKTLSESYPATVALLKENKAEDASKEFRARFSPTIKKLYSEAAKTYPTRFSKVDNWCEWAKQLYSLTRDAEDALKAPNAAKASAALADLRRHFYMLHEKAGNCLSNDYIYAFRTAVQNGAPSVDALKSLLKSLDGSKPSAKAAAEAGAFKEAKADWEETVKASLTDDRLEDSELQSLRQSTEAFYEAFGVQFQ